MATKTDSTIFLTIKKQNKQWRPINRCSICGKDLKKFVKRTENPLTCWTCMVVMQISKEVDVVEIYLLTEEENERAHALT